MRGDSHFLLQLLVDNIEAWRNIETYTGSRIELRFVPVLFSCMHVEHFISTWRVRFRREPSFGLTATLDTCEIW